VQKEVIEGLRESEERYWNEVGGRGGKKGGLVGTSNVSRIASCLQYLHDLSDQRRRIAIDIETCDWGYSCRRSILR
jgi:hypothetical protein